MTHIIPEQGWILVQNKTENRLRRARGPVHFHHIRYIDETVLSHSFEIILTQVLFHILLSMHNSENNTNYLLRLIANISLHFSHAIQLIPKILTFCGSFCKQPPFVSQLLQQSVIGICNFLLGWCTSYIIYNPCFSQNMRWYCVCINQGKALLMITT